MPNAHKTIVGPYDNTHFGQIIREAVEAQGISQAEFAARLGVSQPRVHELFSLPSMTERMLDRCVEALGLRLEVRITTR